jgi:hypothetical protein
VTKVGREVKHGRDGCGPLNKGCERRVLAEAAEILKLTEPERDRILLDFLRKCWMWRIEALPQEREPTPKNAFSEAGQASTAG